MIEPSAGDLVRFYNYDTGLFSAGVVVSICDYDHAPSQAAIASTKSMQVLCDGEMHIVPISDSDFAIEVLV